MKSIHVVAKSKHYGRQLILSGKDVGFFADKSHESMINKLTSKLLTISKHNQQSVSLGIFNYEPKTRLN